MGKGLTCLKGPEGKGKGLMFNGGRVVSYRKSERCRTIVVRINVLYVGRFYQFPDLTKMRLHK